MIDFLVADYGLDRVEAYMLCSVAGDLRMHEVVCGHANIWIEILNAYQVDMPNYVVRDVMSAF